MLQGSSSAISVSSIVRAFQRASCKETAQVLAQSTENESGVISARLSRRVCLGRLQLPDQMQLLSPKTYDAGDAERKGAEDNARW